MICLHQRLRLMILRRLETPQGSGLVALSNRPWGRTPIKIALSVTSSLRTSLWKTNSSSTEMKWTQSIQIQWENQLRMKSPISKLSHLRRPLSLRSLTSKNRRRMTFLRLERIRNRSPKMKVNRTQWSRMMIKRISPARSGIWKALHFRQNLQISSERMQYLTLHRR